MTKTSATFLRNQKSDTLDIKSCEKLVIETAKLASNLIFHNIYSCLAEGVASFQSSCRKSAMTPMIQEIEIL